MSDTEVYTWETSESTSGSLTNAELRASDVAITLDGEQIGVSNFPDLITELYDSIVLDYTGSQLTAVIYKLSGATVATLTLNYDGATFTGVTKT